MKSKAKILAELLDKKFEEMGLPKPKEEKKTGSFVYIPSNNTPIKKSNNQERK